MLCKVPSNLTYSMMNLWNCSSLPRAYLENEAGYACISLRNCCFPLQRMYQTTINTVLIVQQELLHRDLDISYNCWLLLPSKGCLGILTRAVAPRLSEIAYYNQLSSVCAAKQIVIYTTTYIPLTISLHTSVQIFFQLSNILSYWHMIYLEHIFYVLHKNRSAFNHAVQI